MRINSGYKWVLLLGLAIPGIVIGYIVYGFVGRWRLINKHDVVMGKIYQCSQGVKGSPQACNVYYRYLVNGTVYDGATLFRPAQLTYENCRTYMVGHNFPVVYEYGNAGNSLLLLTPGQCRLYEYTFPDSLKWSLQYVHDE